MLYSDPGDLYRFAGPPGAPSLVSTGSLYRYRLSLAE